MEKTFLILLAVIGLFGCQDEEPLVLNYTLTGNFVVPTNVSIAASTQLPAEQMASLTDSVLEANGLSFSEINRVELTSVTLTTNDTLATDMEFLREIDLYIKSNAEPQMLVASSGDLPETLGDSVVITGTTRDLTPFLTEDSLQFWPTLIIDQNVLTNTRIRVNFGLMMETE